MRQRFGSGHPTAQGENHLDGLFTPGRNCESPRAHRLAGTGSVETFYDPGIRASVLNGYSPSELIRLPSVAEIQFARVDGKVGFGWRATEFRSAQAASGPHSADGGECRASSSSDEPRPAGHGPTPKVPDLKGRADYEHRGGVRGQEKSG